MVDRLNIIEIDGAIPPQTLYMTYQGLNTEIPASGARQGPYSAQDSRDPILGCTSV
jgi:hypothetical protein